MGHIPSASMSQKIFKLNLDTQTISLYLLCCGLVDADEAVSLKNLKGIWNGSLEALAAGLEDLVGRGILREVVADGSEEVIYRLNNDDRWHRS